MESLGEKLKNAREEKGLEFEQAARETNIAVRYLTALESEDFSVFPGEAYLIGFLRNYSEYLGLNSQQTIALYKNLCIQAQPVPVEELLPPKKSRLKTIAVAACAAVIVALGALFLPRLFNKAKDAPAETHYAREPVDYTLEAESLENRFYAGDRLLVHANGDVYRVVIAETAPAVALETPVGSRIIQLSEEIGIDLNDDGVFEFSALALDLAKNRPDYGAEIRFTPLDKNAAPAAPAEVSVAAQTASSSSAAYTTLFESGSAYPFTMSAVFRGYCLFRYESDNKTREERYYQKSDTQTILSNNGIRLWISNANAVQVSVIAGGRTVNLPLGRSGEVQVQDIKWIREAETGRYKLVVMNVD